MGSPFSRDAGAEGAVAAVENFVEVEGVSGVFAGGDEVGRCGGMRLDDLRDRVESLTSGNNDIRNFAMNGGTVQ